jgi:hypothetical protein
MARISLDPPQTLAYRIGTWFIRRRYGTMLDPGAAVAHNSPVARTYALLELQAERWRALGPGLKDLAVNGLVTRPQAAMDLSGLVPELAEVNGGPGLLFLSASGAAVVAMTWEISGGLVSGVQIITNPDKLAALSARRTLPL